MGLLLLTGFVLMLISFLPRWPSVQQRRWLSIAWTATASAVVLLLVLLDQLPRGF